MSSQLDEIPSALEIKQAVWSCNLDRAPGYDVFNIRFIKEMCPSLRTDITQSVRQFFLTREFPTSINIAWVNFVPKIKNPTKLHDYRPISVIRCLYNIILKVFANRLKPVIGEVKSENQTCFIQHRLIFDGNLNPT